MIRFVILLLALTSSAQAQFLMTGVSGHSGAASGGAYVGIGDLVAGGGYPTMAGYWGLRCYSAAYAGNVADLNLVSTGASAVTISCSGGTMSPSVASLQLTCGTTGASCDISKLYDQSGLGHDVIQAINANRPPFGIADGTTSCGSGTNFLTAGRFCLGNNGSSDFLKNAAGLNIAAQPIQFAVVGMRVGTAVGVFANCNDTTTLFINGRNAVANTWQANSGSALNSGTTATDSVWHAGAADFNGASSNIWVDNAKTSGTTGTANVCGAVSFYITSGASGGSKLNGFMTEAAVFSTTSFSAGNVTAIYGNQKAYWGAIP